MATINQYRVWCETENSYVLVWGENDPTTCPNNNTHTVDASKTVITRTITEELPISPDTNKLAVQASAKPMLEGDTYAVWAGAGDDPTTGEIGGGGLLDFTLTPGTPIFTKDVFFHADNGRVWLNEAYIRYEGAGAGDSICGIVIGPATALQQSVNLDLVVEDNRVKYATGSPIGPGNGTHGFAATPILVPRSFSKDGDWDYDGVNLTPNFAGTGGYIIRDIETPVHKFVNNIPCRGTTSTYFNLASDDTTELVLPYFIRIEIHNNSDTTWNAQVFMEIYRERTLKP